MVVTNAKKQQFGMTFIEVLIAVFILAVGILGVVAMEASAKKGSFDSLQRSLASALAQDIIERMRANEPSEAILNGYIGSFGTGELTAPQKRCQSSTDACSHTEVVSNDLFEWEQALIGANIKAQGQNAGGLAEVSGCITHAANRVKVVISWRGRTETSDAALDANCGVAGKARRQVMVETYVF